MYPRTTPNHHGFTLIEVMITMSLIVIITGIVYSSLSSVVASTEYARVAAEEMRLRQFLTRNLERNLAQVYPDWQPGASLRDPQEAQRQQESQQVIDNTEDRFDEDELIEEATYWLEGKDDSGPDGPADTLSFATTAPLSGGSAMPGLIKQVTYEIVDQSETDETLLFLEDDSRVLMLQCTEVPIYDLASLREESLDGLGDRADLLDEYDFETPGWSVPISSMNILYFDGEDWIDDWDSVTEGRLPWAIQFSINFARPPGDQEVGFDPVDDPDMKLIVPLPGGMGVTEPPVGNVHRLDEGLPGGSGTPIGGRPSEGAGEPDPDISSGGSPASAASGRRGSSDRGGEDEQRNVRRVPRGRN